VRFSSNPKRSAARAELYGIIVENFSKLNASEVITRLDDAQIGNAQMNNMHDVWAHQQLKTRDRWRDVDTPVGPIKAMLPPGVPDAFSPRMDPIPSVGQHTEKILAELGYDGAAIDDLRARGVI
jgi:itaconate CoA-transferase